MSCEITSTIKAAVILQVVSTIVTHLLLGVGEDGEGLAYLLKLLLLLLLHLCGCRTVAVWKAMKEDQRGFK